MTEGGEGRRVKVICRDMMDNEARKMSRNKTMKDTNSELVLDACTRNREGMKSREDMEGLDGWLFL